MILNLFDRMKLPFRKNKEFLSALYDILGFYPHNIEIYRIAFSHKSLSYRRDADSKKGGKDRKANNRDRKPRSENTSKPLNNERLEYLGDAVLETIVSDILFHHFPHKREGFLTSTRSKIVQREALNRLAADMGLEKLILAAQGTRMSHTNIGGNAFEALMGAIYLDRGFKTCQWFINNRVIGQYVDLDNVAQKEVNFKSKLLEWSQKNRININFKDSACDGEKGFRTVISIEGITIARGSGRSKKESQQEASKEALTRMRREPATYDSIFRAKEKRTAMEAEESFALPKIDTIEDGLSKGKTSKAKGKNKADAPVLDEQDSKAPKSAQELTDEAYDTAYDEAASYEVIDTPPAEPVLTAEDYEAKGIPAPPEEDELKAADESLRKKRTRNRGPKTMGDAVKGQTKGATTTEERAAKREAERQAEVERQRAKAEHKRQMAEKAKAKAEATETKAEPEPLTEAVANEAQTQISGLLGALRTHADHEAETIAENRHAKTETPSHTEAETPVAPSAEMANDADTAHTTDEVQTLAEVEETFIIKEDIKPAQQAEDESQEAALESQEATNERHEAEFESQEAANEALAEVETDIEPETKPEAETDIEPETKPEAETAFDSATEKAENEAGEADKVAEESDSMAVDTDSVAEEGDDTTINTIDTDATADYTATTAVETTEAAETEDKDLDNDSEPDAATSIVPSLTLDDIVFGTEHDEHFATLRNNNFDSADSKSDTAAQEDEAEATQDKPQRNKKRTNNNRRRRRPQNANKQGTESDANGKAENATSANAPTANADKPKPHKHRGRRRPNKGKKEGDA